MTTETPINYAAMTQSELFEQYTILNNLTFSRTVNKLQVYTDIQVVRQLLLHESGRS